jgi:hypothetical protein
MEHAAAQVEGTAIGLELLLEGVGPGGDSLGLERLQGEGDGHLTAEHRGEVLLQGDDIDELETAPIQPHHHIPADLHVPGSQRLIAGDASVIGHPACAETRRVADNGRTVDQQPPPAAPHCDTALAERVEGSLLGIHAEREPAAAHPDLPSRLAHGDAHRLHGECGRSHQEAEEQCNRPQHGAWQCRRP